jgi:hypothetical protein
VQKDKDDFIDSLRRIVRDLEFDENGAVGEALQAKASSAQSSTTKTESARPPPPAAASSSSSSSAAPTASQPPQKARETAETSTTADGSHIPL